MCFRFMCLASHLSLTSLPRRLCKWGLVWAYSVAHLPPGGQMAQRRPAPALTAICGAGALGPEAEVWTGDQGDPMA